jgi:hypothetical protein
MSKIQQVPPTSGVQDPEVRRVLNAIIAMLNTRNGVVGSGEDSFLTVGDLNAWIEGKSVKGLRHKYPRE